MSQRLLVEHGVLPGAFLKAPPGEQILTRALYIDYKRRKDGEI